MKTLLQFVLAFAFAVILTAPSQATDGYSPRPSELAPNKPSLAERGAKYRAKRDAAKKEKAIEKRNREEAKRIAKYRKDLAYHKKRVKRLSEKLARLKRETSTRTWTRDSDIRKHQATIRQTKKELAYSLVRIRTLEARLAARRTLRSIFLIE